MRLDIIDAKLAGIFADPDPDPGLRRAKLLATDLAKTHPDAAGSLREGLEDMFIVRRLGIDGTLARTLTTTNMIESMFSIVDTTTRNVKRWRDEGDMRRRWAASAEARVEPSDPISEFGEEVNHGTQGQPLGGDGPLREVVDCEAEPPHHCHRDNQGAQEAQVSAGRRSVT